MKINSCRICNTKKLKKLFSLGDLCFTGKFPKINQQIKKKPIQLVMCDNCGLVQLGHNFDLKYLYGPDYGYRTGINKTMLNHVESVVKDLTKKTKLKMKDLVLDIASNDGSLLNFYNRKIITFGIDPILNKYKENYKNINYKVEDFFSLKKIKNKTSKKFKVITALSVFYDSEKPNQFLNDVKNLLDQDGLFILEFADLASIIKKKMFDTICHEHLEYYSSQIIIEMCKNNQLKVIDIFENDINGASKQFYISRGESNFKINKSKIRKILNTERNMRINSQKTLKSFFNEIKKIKIKLITLLKEIKKRGQTIHGYGASTKGNVLLQYFGIDKFFIDYISERNPLKYGLYTPGTKIEIISEENSRKIKPNFYLVLPWHFKKEILSREKNIRTRGTKFIFPLPKIKIH